MWRHGDGFVVEQDGLHCLLSLEKSVALFSKLDGLLKTFGAEFRLELKVPDLRAGSHQVWPLSQHFFHQL